jgi:hypothetical protein
MGRQYSMNEIKEKFINVLEKEFKGEHHSQYLCIDGIILR